MNWRALKTSAYLSLLFFLVYGSSNGFTAMRHDVGSWYFPWERHIPFVPIMIVPYMSIDLFFLAAPFICENDEERKILVRQITTAILAAGICFLLFPLKFAFERPHVDGWLGLVFNNFRQLDQPFNQLPSLHIALRTILAVLYAKHSGGISRWLSHIWFSLIGLSTLLTYQHHIADVIGGFALGAMCIYLWQDQPLRLPVACNRRIGVYYGAASIAILGLAVATRPIGLVLLWPALSFAIVSVAYFGLGPGIFRKKAGTIPPISWLILWPILLGQRASLLFYAGQCEPWNELTDRIWIGRKLSNAEAIAAIDQGVSSVLDLTGELSEAKPFFNTNYLQLPIMDLTAPSNEQVDTAIAFVRKHSATGIVYIHCKAGYSRTAAVAGAYLLAENDALTVEDVVQILQSSRPAIVIRPEVKHSLQQFSVRRSSPGFRHQFACQTA